MFRLLVSYAIVAAALTGAASAQGILPEGAKWEKVSSAGKAFGEGVVAAKDGSIYLVDLAPPGATMTAVRCAELTATASGGLATLTMPAPARKAARATSRPQAKPRTFP